MRHNFYYTVSVPDNFRRTEEYPVLIALHGIGYHESHMMSLFNQITDTFILISIRGPLPYEDGFAYYYLKDYGRPEQGLFKESIDNLSSFIDTVMEKYPVNREHVYIAGFSQGAILCNSLALILGKKIKGIISMNGYVPEFIKDKFSTKPITHLSVFLSDGEKDNIFPPVIGKNNKEFFKKEGATIVYKTYPTQHEIGDNNKQDAIRWLLSNYNHYESAPY